MSKEIRLKPVVAGSARGETLVSKIPLSFWGGVDAHNGVVVDIRHDLLGKSVTGKILFIPGSRGSCSGSGIILEMIRQNNAPAAIVSITAEPILATGSIIGKEIYGKTVPIFTIEESLYQDIEQNKGAAISAGGDHENRRLNIG